MCQIANCFRQTELDLPRSFAKSFTARIIVAQKLSQTFQLTDKRTRQTTLSDTHYWSSIQLFDISLSRGFEFERRVANEPWDDGRVRRACRSRWIPCVDRDIRFPRNFPRRNDESLEASLARERQIPSVRGSFASFQRVQDSRRWKPGKPWQMTEFVRLMSRHCAAHHADIPVPVHGDWSQIASAPARRNVTLLSEVENRGKSTGAGRTHAWIVRVRRRRESMGNSAFETEEYWNEKKKILIFWFFNLLLI